MSQLKVGQQYLFNERGCIIEITNVKDDFCEYKIVKGKPRSAECWSQIGSPYAKALTLHKKSPLEDGEHKYNVGDEIPIIGTIKIKGIQVNKAGQILYQTDKHFTIYEDVLEQMKVPKAKEQQPEPKEPFKYYCIKSLSGILTKGKVYKAVYHPVDLCYFIVNDKGDKIFTRNDNSVPDYYKQYLVPMVKRPAKVGEWVYILDGVLEGVVGKVYDLTDCGKPCVKHPAVSVSNKNVCERTILYMAEYLVLDGYKPIFYNGKIICTEKGYGNSEPLGYLTVGKTYNVVDGVFTFDNGRKSSQYESIEDICIGTGYKFIKSEGEG